jgi:hypothetical protein
LEQSMLQWLLWPASLNRVVRSVVTDRHLHVYNF